MTRTSPPAPPLRERGSDMRGPLKTKTEVADRARVSERTVQREVDRGRLRCVRVGRQIRFRVEDVDAWLSDD